MERKVFKLADDVIAQIARLVQIGFVTGTDITDHFRQIRLEQSSDENVTGDALELNLTPEYREYDGIVVNKLLDEAQTLLNSDPSEAN